MNDDDTPDEQQQHLDETPSGLSVLDEVRAIRDEKVAEQPRRFCTGIPAYVDASGKARVSVIYTYPEAGQAAVMGSVRRERMAIAKGDADARLEAAGDLLIASCGSVVGRTGDGRLVDLLTDADLGTDADPQLPETPLRFGPRLAELFQIDVPPEVEHKSRFILRNVFSPRGQATGVYEGDVAIISTSDAVFQFVQGVDLAADEAAAGE